MFQTIAEALLIGYLPGALLFRLPLADRSRREALPAEERAFWAIFISIALSSTVALALAAAGSYTFDRLLLANGIFCACVVAAARGRLRLGPDAPRPTPAALIPLAFVVLGTWLYFPPSEYIIGGKDPGVYLNEGIQIAQRGALVTQDPVVATVPPPSRELFFPNHDTPHYYGDRFMGNFVLDPDSGDVIGQFPQLFPVWIAIGYGMEGLTGARGMVGVWAILGLLAVYFAGVRLVGRTAAAAATALLAIHVLEVWFARYPNSELTSQALLLSGLLAFDRAHVDRDRFFALVSATLLGLLLFVRFDAVLALGAVGFATCVGIGSGHRYWRAFVLPLSIWTALAAVYYFSVLTPYSGRLFGFMAALSGLQRLAIGIAALAFGALLIGVQRPAIEARFRRIFPWAVIAAVWILAVYAYFWRSPGPGLATHDALALRTFTDFYLSPYGLAAALLGFSLLVRRAMWQSPALISAGLVYSLFFFYKLRIFPEHFWTGRRFLPIILPLMLLCAAGAAFAAIRGQASWNWRDQRQVRHLAIGGLRFGIGLAFIVLLGRGYLKASLPIADHVEYAGVVPRLEQLADHFGDRDLVIVEAREASDVHILALPLAYIYARNVLVLNTHDPDRVKLLEFLTWAENEYERVFYIGGGGSTIASRTLRAQTVDALRFELPEYESPMNAYPRAARLKKFDIGIYRLEAVADSGPAGDFTLDLGGADDLHVLRFFAKERLSSGTTFRWTSDYSFISIVNALALERQLILWLNDGGRPPQVERARVTVSVVDRTLGEVVVTSSFEPYVFSIPDDLATRMAQSRDPVMVRITSNTWNPQATFGNQDDRNLGVMVDRIEIR